MRIDVSKNFELFHFKDILCLHKNETALTMAVITVTLHDNMAKLYCLY